MLKRIAYLQHIDIETPASILDWATKNDLSVSGSHLYRGDELPNIEEFDALVVMGGPMGAKDDHLYPWMRPEKQLIEAAITAGKKIVGICLGAQFLADVLSARVYPNGHKEIGWFPITWTEAARQSLLFSPLPKEQTVFHWHGDTFDLPAGARHLASSAACPNQAWQYGANVLAFQFHLEVKPENVKLMTERFAEELVGAPFIQSAAEMLAGTSFCRSMNEAMFETLDKFILDG